MENNLKKEIRNNPWVDVPLAKDVRRILKKQTVADTYYKRGDGQATKDLEYVEAAHRNWVNDIIDLSEFPYCYFTNGATDAIHYWLLTEDREYQYYQGEYEYPMMIKPGHAIANAYAKNQLIDPDKVLYVSVPSACDGNFSNLQDINCPVILDCTYVSSTNIQKINTPKNTEQVMFSFSKGFGLVGQRLGLVYTKEPHKTLHTLKELENWNYGGVRTIELIMSNYKVDDMWNTHRSKQIEICNEYDFIPSDCYFLSTSLAPYYKRRRRTTSNNAARLCLTALTKW